MRALPKKLTAGLIAASFSVACTNSAIMPSTRHDSRAAHDFSLRLGRKRVRELVFRIIYPAVNA